MGAEPCPTVACSWCEGPQRGWWMQAEAAGDRVGAQAAEHTAAHATERVCSGPPQADTVAAAASQP